MNINSIVISIGNEILLGRTLNSNLSFLGRELSRLGIPILRCLCIQDEDQEIQQALLQAWQEADVVISTGGLGPTLDDLTRQSIADFFGKELRFDEDVWDYIQAMFQRRNMMIPESNRAQAMVPEGFEVLQNHRGTAPGLYYKASGKHFFALQGVPGEMREIFSQQIAPILKQAFPMAKEIVQRDLHTFNIGESALAEIVHEDELPRQVNLAWLPQTGRVDLRIYGNDVGALHEAEQIIRAKAGEYVWGVDDEDPSQSLIRALKHLGYSISVAESCTGGLLQKLLSDVAGCSEVFWGGVISYHNDVKTKLLGVPETLLEKWGAVSPECAESMALGVQRLLATDVAISITGIAGPDGGSPEKPVGTVYFGFRIGEQGIIEHRLLFGDRESIRHKAAETAILLLHNELRKLLK
ncbi:MAG: competence/damage-inducible protein A [Candidatus Cloacimonetes bacterium]|nr:competence/damage-inducible protein A [Candidatus Cloacimonadota bacterium]MDD3578730.1 competence/damage-inducible protein A [Candidatus Cloacimonadota bacterium]MDD4033922.1 competence/damage-inducible protein A [Candidatus Cloacimonadota bacterium]MDD4667002.1 competence/damage-inducible protein A [Candidatus Cloacimonadota bacterium]